MSGQWIQESTTVWARYLDGYVLNVAHIPNSVNDGIWGWGIWDTTPKLLSQGESPTLDAAQESADDEIKRLAYINMTDITIDITNVSQEVLAPLLQGYHWVCVATQEDDLNWQQWLVLGHKDPNMVRPNPDANLAIEMPDGTTRQCESLYGVPNAIRAAWEDWHKESEPNWHPVIDGEDGIYGKYDELVGLLQKTGFIVLPSELYWMCD